MVASSYFIIDQKVKEINSDINRSAVGFSELTADRIIDNYENNYTQKAYAHFNREMADIYRLNEDISSVSIYDYKGKNLYNSASKTFDQIAQAIPEEMLYMPAEEMENRIKEFDDRTLMADLPPEDMEHPGEGPDGQNMIAHLPDNTEEENRPPEEDRRKDFDNKLTANLGDSLRGQEENAGDQPPNEPEEKPPHDIQEENEIKALKKLNTKDLGATHSSAEKKLSSADLERIQAIYMSIKTKTGSIVYMDKSDGEVRYTNFNGRTVKPISESTQIEDIIYPFRDSNNALRSYSIRYTISYKTLTDRVAKTRNNMMVLVIFGIAIALFIGEVIAGKITSPIQALTEGVERIGSGDLTTQIVVKSKSEIGKLASTFNKMAQDLQKNTEDLITKEKMTHELELAGEIQRELLPKNPPKIKNLDIAASLDSADEVGGDCYDFLEIDKNNLIFYIGDVTGHGVPAGLVSAINNALVPAFLQHYKTTDELITHLNEILKLKTRSNVFMTMVMAHWHTDKNTLGFTQAGHDPILYYDQKKKTVTEMATGGMALGMMPDISKIVKTEHIKMNVNDVAVLYTDGIPEAWKNKDETYGMDKFKESVAKHSGLKTAQEIHDGIIKDVRSFMGDYPQADDITIIVVKRTV